MKNQRTAINSKSRIKISRRTRELYERRDRNLDNDPEARQLPPEKWAHAIRREEFFRPIKKPVTARIDADVLDWLKSKGEGHLTRMNALLREAMQRDLNKKPGRA